MLVGDAKSDVEMARRAKIIPMVVLTGHLKKGEAQKLKVEYIIKDISQLEKTLNKINST